MELYTRYIKRILDFFVSLFALVIFSPVLLLLTVLGFVMMQGNPFYVQLRPGKGEKIFKLIKFRTMSNEKDSDGKLLPDNIRLNEYGRILRSTSLDELPEFINILKGDMSIVGPRPLMVQYLPYYTERERLRHSVRPGLTGNAQVHGRNALTWNERFDFDLEYVDKITFKNDMQIIIQTVRIVFMREGIELHELGDLDNYRKM